MKHLVKLATVLFARRTAESSAQFRQRFCGQNESWIYLYWPTGRPWLDLRP